MTNLFITHINLGLDGGGGGFLKVSLGIQQSEQRLEAMSPPSKKAAASPIVRDSGVKKLLPIAIAEDVPKNYNNVQKILYLIGIEKVHLVLSIDLKLANIVCGFQSHASSHPCTWFDVFHKNFAICYAPQIFYS